MAIQRSKYTGDPGIFGDIWGGIKKVAGVGLGVASMLPVVGGAAKVLRSLAFPGDARVNIPGATTLPSFPVGGIMPNVPVGMPGSGRPGPNVARAIGAPAPTNGCPGIFNVKGPGGVCIDLTALPPGGDPAFTPMAMAANGMNGMDPMSMRAGTPSGWPGYHWNKSDYFLRSGEFVPAGSRSVRNRKRNPMNPRATSNAITRVKGAKRFAASLSNITIRKKC